MRRAIFVLAVLAASSITAFADPIAGQWRTQAGPIATISPCGAQFCITMKTGKYAGKRIGRFRPDGDGSYSGTITDPTNDKTYSGSASLAGSALELSGCVMGILCRSQTWKRQ